MYNNNNFQKTTGRSRDVPLVLYKTELNRNQIEKIKELEIWLFI